MHHDAAGDQAEPLEVVLGGSVPRQCIAIDPGATGCGGPGDRSVHHQFAQADASGFRCHIQLSGNGQDLSTALVYLNEQEPQGHIVNQCQLDMGVGPVERCGEHVVQRCRRRVADQPQTPSPRILDESAAFGAEAYQFRYIRGCRSPGTFLHDCSALQSGDLVQDRAPTPTSSFIEAHSLDFCLAQRIEPLHDL